MNEGRLTIYNGVDSNGSGIALPSSDIPPFSKLMEITDAWAQTIILANNNITIPAGSTSGGIELVASIAENAEIPEYISIKLKNDAEYSGQFTMNTTAISTQEELDNFFASGQGPMMTMQHGSFVDDRIISWDIGSSLGNSYFADDFVLEFEVDYTSSQALQQAFTTALKEAGFSGGWSASGDVFNNGQTSYEAAVNEGRLTIYNGVDSNGSGIALPSSDIPPFSKLMEITDAWAQTIILANNNITIPAGSTSGGIELVASIAENAEIPEYISIKLKNDAEYSGQFTMNTTAISTQEELDNFFASGQGPMMTMQHGSFVDDRIISWDIGSSLGNSYFADDFVLEFEVDYTSSQALQQAFTTALKEAGFSGGWSASGDVFNNGQTSYEAAVNEGRLTIYNGVDSNGSGIALPSSDIPPFSKLMEITDAWAQTIILANNNITIPAGSTSGGIELVASIAENAEIPEYISIKLKNDAEYSGQFTMNTTAISTQEELDNFFASGQGPMMTMQHGSFNSNYEGPENQPAEYINIQEGDALNYSVDLSENEISNITFELFGDNIRDSSL